MKILTAIFNLLHRNFLHQGNLLLHHGATSVCDALFALIMIMILVNTGPHLRNWWDTCGLVAPSRQLETMPDDQHHTPVSFFFFCFCSLFRSFCICVFLYLLWSHLMGWWDTCGWIQTSRDDARRPAAPAHSGFQTTIPHILPQISDTFTPLICHLGSCGCLGSRGPDTAWVYTYDTPRGSENPRRA